MTPDQFDTRYQNREIDEKFRDIKETLGRIETQTTRTNGRVTKIERALLIIGTATVVLLVTNGSNLLTFLKTIAL